MQTTAIDIARAANDMRSRKANYMTLLRIKVWEAHSLSRINNSNEPYSFGNLSNKLGKEDYLRYINQDLIDVSDMGGKDIAIQVINKWFS